MVVIFFFFCSHLRGDAVPWMRMSVWIHYSACCHPLWPHPHYSIHSAARKWIRMQMCIYMHEHMCTHYGHARMETWHAALMESIGRARTHTRAHTQTHTRTLSPEMSSENRLKLPDCSPSPSMLCIRWPDGARGAPQQPNTAQTQQMGKTSGLY